MRYYLDIRLVDEAIAVDHDGIDVETMTQAFIAAHTEAAGLVTDAIQRGEALLACAILVRDAANRTLFEVPVDLLSLLN